jgi:uroporphyrinogen decarboxylase
VTRPETHPDGISAQIPREQLTGPEALLRDYYDQVPGAELIQTEFGFMAGVAERWHNEGLPADQRPGEPFENTAGGAHSLGRLGWCEAAFCPAFEEKVLEDRGDHELVQDFAGRGVLTFKGRRSGFMPEYVDHPVKDIRTWEENVKWRLDPQTPQRWEGFEDDAARAVQAARDGKHIIQRLVGGYMYLRSLIGPGELLYAFYDTPDLIHDCMRTWLALAEAVVSRFQQHVSLDEVFLAEDICYNHGPLISPEMMAEFLFPYYQQLLSGVRSRQIDKARPLHVAVDTDGQAEPVIRVYAEAIGMDRMNPFEVASGCDVVEIGRKHPNLLMNGGIDKRVLAQGPEAIDRHLAYILPAMKARGGYFPTCDHMVPVEVSFENYCHYRKRLAQYAGT